MEQFGALFLRVCTVSAGCSAVLALLLALLPKLREKIAARSLYVLFLVLALRLVLPVEVRLPVPAVELPAPDLTLSVPAASTHSPAAKPAPGQTAVQAPVQAAPRPVKKVPVLYVFGVAWAVGVLACAAFSVGSYALARKRLLGGSRPAEGEEAALLERLRTELGVKRPVALRRSETAPGPLALGLFRPVIVLGDGPAEELILRHELTHIRRWDVAYKLALSLACWVNWFNPLVWLMDRAAGRNLELCCDDEVTRDLSDAERRRYGNLLLDAAAVRPIPFSTCFSGGKTQMKERLLNLFTHKRNSAVLVGLVLIAALLAGGLVACDQSGSVEPPKAPDAAPMGAGAVPTVTPAVQQPAPAPENEARRALLKDYFYQNFTEDNASVVLADLTGDGLEEMLVLTMDSGSGAVNLRKTLSDFSFGQIKYFGVSDGAVVEYPMTSDVASAHAGWGYVYLVPRPDGDGFAILDFRPYTGQGMASYTYAVYGLEGLDEVDEWLWLDGGEAYFSLDPVELMNPDNGDDATPEETQALLDRVQAYRDSGVALLAFNESYDGTTGEWAYLDTAPADVFGGRIDMTVSGLREHVISNGEPVQFALPPAGPASPEEALDRLEASVQAYPDGYVFRVPNYKGEWSIHIAGRMRMDHASHPADTPEMFMSVHYLENEEWKPGKRYSFEVPEGAYFSELTLFAVVTAPDGTEVERDITLAGPQNEADSGLPDG